MRSFAQCSQLNRMYVNRANAAWAEQHTLPWSPASVLWDTPRCVSKFGRAAYDAAVEEVVRALSEGAVAVSLVCGDGNC